MPNVTSETHNSSSIAVAAAMHFGYLFLLLLHRLLLLMLLAPGWKTPWKKSPAGRKTPCLGRTEKPQNCTPKMPNVTSETHNSTSIAVAAAMHFGYLFLLLLCILATFSSCCCIDFCCCCCWLPDGKHHGKNHLPAGKHHASEGRRGSKIAPRKCLT